MSFQEELMDFRMDIMLRDMNIQERAIMLKKLLGPLSDPRVLTNREASFYFCHVARDASAVILARDFRCSPQRILEVLGKAEGKIEHYHRRN